MKTEIFPAGQKNIEETLEFPGIVNFSQLDSYPLHSVIHEYNNYFLRPASYSVFAKISSSFKAYYYDPHEIRPAIRERTLTSSEIYDFKQDIKEFKKLYEKLLELFNSSDIWAPFPLRCSKIIIEYYYLAYKIPLELIGKIISMSICNMDIPTSPDYKHSPGSPGLELFDRMEANEVYKKYNRFFYRTEINLIQSWTSSQLEKGTYFDYEYDSSVVPMKIEKRKGKSINRAQFLNFLEKSSKKFERGQIAEYTSSSQITYRFKILNQESGNDVYMLDINNIISLLNTFNPFSTPSTNLAFCSTVTGPYQNSTHTFSNDEKMMKTPFSLPVEDQKEFDFNNDPESLWQLGICYANGIYGFKKNPENAANLFRQASLQGHANALNSLGYCYYNGAGVTKDINEAVRLYRLAVDKGNVFAQYNLGLLHKNGSGVDRDHKEAVRLFRLAAGQNHGSAQRKLAHYYHAGEGGLKRDDKEAFRLYRLSANPCSDLRADRRDQKSIKALIEFYKLGIGVIKDVNESRQWEMILKEYTAKNSPNGGS